MREEHYDKHNEVNTDDLENYIFDGEKRYKERYVAMFLVFVGIVGLSYMLMLPEKEVNEAAAHTIYKTETTTTNVDLDQTINTTSNTPKSTPPATSKKKKRKVSKHLLIDGHMEAKDPVYFTIKSFDKNATYTLRLSNGKSQKLNKKKSKYIFKEPGFYHVELDVTYKGQTKTIAQTGFEIMEAIAIAPEANRTDFQ